jgi:hypothetical protein
LTNDGRTSGTRAIGGPGVILYPRDKGEGVVVVAVVEEAEGEEAEVELIEVKFCPAYVISDSQPSQPQNISVEQNKNMVRQ